MTNMSEIRSMTTLIWIMIFVAGVFTGETVLFSIVFSGLGSCMYGTLMKLLSVRC